MATVIPSVARGKSRTKSWRPVVHLSRSTPETTPNILRVNKRSNQLNCGIQQKGSGVHRFEVSKVDLISALTLLRTYSANGIRIDVGVRTQQHVAESQTSRQMTFTSPDPVTKTSASAMDQKDNTCFLKKPKGAFHPHTIAQDQTRCAVPLHHAGKNTGDSFSPSSSSRQGLEMQRITFIGTIANKRITYSIA